MIAIHQQDLTPVQQLISLRRHFSASPMAVPGAVPGTGGGAAEKQTGAGSGTAGIAEGSTGAATGPAAGGAEASTGLGTPRQSAPAEAGIGLHDPTDASSAEQHEGTTSADDGAAAERTAGPGQPPVDANGADPPRDQVPQPPGGNERQAEADTAAAGGGDAAKPGGASGDGSSGGSPRESGDLRLLALGMLRAMFRKLARDVHVLLDVLQARAMNLSGPRPRTSQACFTGSLRPYRTCRCALGMLVFVLSPTSVRCMLVEFYSCFVLPAKSITAHFRYDLVLMQGQLSVRIMRRLVETDFDEEEFLVRLCSSMTCICMYIGIEETVVEMLDYLWTRIQLQPLLPTGVSKGRILHRQRPVCRPGLRHPIAHGVGEAAGRF